MKVQRLALVVAVLLVIGIVLGAVLVHNAQEPPTTCAAFQQEAVLYGFKADVIVWGLGAVLAGIVLYVALLRLQAYFPRADAWRIVTAAGVATGLGLVLAFVDYFVASDCLVRAVGPSSAVPDIVASAHSVAGQVVGYLWLAIGIDLLLMALVAVGLVRLSRELSLRLF